MKFLALKIGVWKQAIKFLVFGFIFEIMYFSGFTFIILWIHATWKS